MVMAQHVSERCPVCLLSWPVEVIKESIAGIGENIQIRRFERFVLGEGIEVAKADLAADVEAQTKAMQVGEMHALFIYNPCLPPLTQRVKLHWLSTRMICLNVELEVSRHKRPLLQFD